MHNTYLYIGYLLGLENEGCQSEVEAIQSKVIWWKQDWYLRDQTGSSLFTNGACRPNTYSISRHHHKEILFIFSQPQIPQQETNLLIYSKKISFYL